MWADKEFIDLGLFPGEQEMFDLIKERKGDLLIYGVGGGREALVLGKNGFRITGVDFVEGLVQKAEEWGRLSGVKINGIVGDINKIDLPKESFDVVWYSCSTYSSIPGRKRRIRSLIRSADILKQEGHIACFFYWNPKAVSGRYRWRLGKIIAYLTFGNISYEKGDLFKDNLEFMHAFFDKQDLVREFSAAGLEVIEFVFPENSHNACALLRKKV